MAVLVDALALRKGGDPPMYQQIAARAAWLRGFGYPPSLIADCTGVTDKTAVKALRWFDRRCSGS